ncbi:MAG: hypothetical protein IPH78_13225 [Bacteroidetes bacterium]|nr:hypothetical protein [Bacteroidota bacterium]
MTQKTLETKRGGYAVAFIYGAIFLVITGAVKLLGITSPYFFMGAAVLTVMVSFYLMPLVFNKPLIKASQDGLWTKSLNSVSWSQVKDIYIEKVPGFSTKGLGRMDIYLIIETTDNRDDKFDVMYLAGGEAFALELIRYWKAIAVNNV